MRTILRYLILIPILPILWLVVGPLVYLLSEETPEEIKDELMSFSTTLWNGKL